MAITNLCAHGKPSDHLGLPTGPPRSSWRREEPGVGSKPTVTSGHSNSLGYNQRRDWEQIREEAELKESPPRAFLSCEPCPQGLPGHIGAQMPPWALILPHI